MNSAVRVSLSTLLALALPVASMAAPDGVRPSDEGLHPSLRGTPDPGDYLGRFVVSGQPTERAAEAHTCSAVDGESVSEPVSQTLESVRFRTLSSSAQGAVPQWGLRAGVGAERIQVVYSLTTITANQRLTAEQMEQVRSCCTGSDCPTEHIISDYTLGHSTSAVFALSELGIDASLGVEEIQSLAMARKGAILDLLKSGDLTELSSVSDEEGDGSPRISVELEGSTYRGTRETLGSEEESVTLYFGVTPISGASSRSGRVELPPEEEQWQGKYSLCTGKGASVFEARQACVQTLPLHLRDEAILLDYSQKQTGKRWKVRGLLLVPEHRVLRVASGEDETLHGGHFYQVIVEEGGVLRLPSIPMSAKGEQLWTRLLVDDVMVVDGTLVGREGRYVGQVLEPVVLQNRDGTPMEAMTPAFDLGQRPGGAGGVGHSSGDKGGAQVDGNGGAGYRFDKDATADLAGAPGGAHWGSCPAVPWNALGADEAGEPGAAGQDLPSSCGVDRNGGGGGGGHRGAHGQALYLRVEGSISGRGEIDLRGQSGGSGGRGGSAGGHSDGIGKPGSGGGGGAGGNGGVLVVHAPAGNAHLSPEAGEESLGVLLDGGFPGVGGPVGPGKTREKEGGIGISGATGQYHPVVIGEE